MSQAQWRDYVNRFRPAEELQIKQAKFTEGERARVKGEVAADVAAAFKGLTRRTHASGLDAQSGKSKLSLAADTMARGKATGVGQTMAVLGGMEDESAKLVRIAGQGRGIAADVTADMSRGARRATGLALAASQARFQHKLATTDAIAAVAGAATRKFGSSLFNKGDKEFKEEFLNYDPTVDSSLDLSGVPTIGTGKIDPSSVFDYNPFES